MPLGPTDLKLLEMHKSALGILLFQNAAVQSFLLHDLNLSFCKDCHFVPRSEVLSGTLIAKIPLCARLI